MVLDLGDLSENNRQCVLVLVMVGVFIGQAYDGTVRLLAWAILLACFASLARLLLLEHREHQPR